MLKLNENQYQENVQKVIDFFLNQYDEHISNFEAADILDIAIKSNSGNTLNDEMIHNAYLDYVG